MVEATQAVAATGAVDAPDIDAVIIGAGFSGLGMLHHMNELGLTSRVFDSATDVGGTWYWNRYPGARTDSEFYYYSFSFSKEIRNEWTWTERYPSQPEVLKYLEFVTDRLNLRKDITFKTRVDTAVYDEDRNLWTVTTDTGERVTARYLISGMGVLSAPQLPKLNGISSFEGETYQTGTWPKGGVDLTGKRVGLIGLGASGIQVLPTVAPVASEVVVFQRTPNYIVATQNGNVDDEWMQYVRDHYDELFAKAAGHPFGVPFDIAEHGALDVDAEERERIFESKWNDGGFHFANETFNDLALKQEASDLASEFIRKKIREIVKDPVTAELLCPKDYPFNGKRVPTGHGYYEAYNRDNVKLIDVKSNPIERVTPKGIIVDGVEHELDVIIYATGFDAMTGTLTRVDIVGRDGVVLRDKWESEGLRTNLGLSVNGYPNFFMILGPQTPYANLPVAIQEGIQWIQQAIKFADDNNLPRIESTVEAENDWADEVDRAGKATIMAQGAKGNAWFLGANIPGKPREFNVYMGGAQNYFARCAAAAESGFKTFINEPVTVQA